MAVSFSLQPLLDMVGLDKASILGATFSLAPGALLGWLINAIRGKKFRKDTELKIKLLEEDLAAREKAAHRYAEENEELKEQARRADKRSPELALAEAAAARKQGNWTPADYRIEQWLDLEGQTIAQIMLDRSQWAFLRARGDELRVPGMITAHAFASAAQLLAPANKAVTERIGELLQWCQHEGISLEPFQPDMLDELRSHHGRLNFDALAAGVELFEIANRLHEQTLSSLALDYVDRAIGLLRGEIGENGLKTLDARQLRAHILHWLGQNEAARKEIEAVIDKKEQHGLRGPDHPDTLMSHYLHAKILIHLGKNVGARTEIEEVIRKQEQHPSVGPDNPDTLRSRYVHAEILGHLGQDDDARTEIEEVTRKRERHPSLGPDHPTTLTSRFLHASILHNLDQDDDARTEIEEVIRKQERHPSCGPDHPDSLMSHYLHANILHNLGKSDDARAEIEEVIGKREWHSSFGPDHPHTLEDRCLHAGILYNLGKSNDARTEIEEVIRKQGQHPSIGPDHTNTLKSRYLHAAILYNLGKNDDARTEIEVVIRKLEQHPSIGPDHPDTVKSRKLLDDLIGR